MSRIRIPTGCTPQQAYHAIQETEPLPTCRSCDAEFDDEGDLDEHGYCEDCAAGRILKSFRKNKQSKGEPK
jgi:hypothetical protein